jgi:hypothetical protein
LESNNIPKVLFGKRATAYPGIALLRDILQAEIGKDQVQEIQEGIDWDTKLLVEGELEFGKPKTTVRGSKTLVTSKICCLACPAVLINLKVSGSGEIQDKL